MMYTSHTILYFPLGTRYYFAISEKLFVSLLNAITVLTQCGGDCIRPCRKSLKISRVCAIRKIKITTASRTMCSSGPVYSRK